MANGAAIEGEVWALPTAAIGALLALVPPPLGFGTVALEDGPCLGFLAEAHALARRARHHRRMAAGAHGWPRTTESHATIRQTRRDAAMTDAELEAFMDASAASSD